MFKLAEIYTRQHCPNCHEALALLTSFSIPTKNLRLEEIGVTEDNTCRIVPKDELLKRVPKAKTLPQIFIDNEYVGGLVELKSKLTIEP